LVDVEKGSEFRVKGPKLFFLQVFYAETVETLHDLMIVGIDCGFERRKGFLGVNGMERLDHPAHPGNHGVEFAPDLYHVTKKRLIEKGHITRDKKPRLFGHHFEAGVKAPDGAQAFDDVGYHGKVEEGVVVRRVRENDDLLKYGPHDSYGTIDQADTAHFHQSLVAPVARALASGENKSGYAGRGASGSAFINLLTGHRL
jgi:hypothetical protein